MDEDLPATNDPNADPPAEQDHQFDEEALPQPAEKDIVMLKKDRNEEEQQKPQQENRPTVQELQRNLKQVQLEIAGRRERMTLKRAQLKNLSLHVEQELQRALVAKAKHPSLNVSEFFSKEGELLQKENPRLGTEKCNSAELHQELRQVRLEQDKLKKELLRVKHEQQAKSFGVDSERFAEVRNKLKNRTEELTALSHDKETLQKEVALISQSIESLNIKETDELTQKHLAIKNELLREVKAHKGQINNIDREDRACTEKLKFLLETSSYSETVRRKNQSVDANASRTVRARLGKDINELAQEISQMLDQKYQVEGSIKQELDRLRSETERLEKDNWATINKLREYDAYLLNYYNAVKAHKKSIRRDASISREEPQQSDRNTAKNSQSLLLREDIIAEVAPSPPPLETIQQFQLMQLGIQENSPSSIVAEDTVEDGVIVSLSIHYLNGVLIGIEAEYSTSLWQRELGFKIISIPRSKQTQTQTFKVDGLQFDSVEVGFSHDPNTIRYLKIGGREAATIVLWGDPSNLNIERKTFPAHYKSINLYGCLQQEECTLYAKAETAKNPNSWYVSGIGFRVCALVTRPQTKKIKSIASRRVRRFHQP